MPEIKIEELNNNQLTVTQILEKSKNLNKDKDEKSNLICHWSNDIIRL